MKKTLVILLVVFSFAANIYAQDAVKPAPAAGTAGLLFTFSGLSNLGAGNFEGGFGGKYFFTKNLAVRGILNFTSASQTDPSGMDGVADDEYTATVIGVGAALEYHFGYKRVSPYLGGGVGFRTASTEFSEEGRTIKNNSNGLNVNGTTFSAGTALEVFGLMGVEFFLFDELSLAAEYRLGFESFSAADQEVEQEGFDTITTEGGSGSNFSLQSQGFLTLAIYF